MTPLSTRPDNVLKKPFDARANANADLAAADAACVRMADGRHGWPSIVQYRWAGESAAGATAGAQEVVSPCPPRLSNEAEIDPKTKGDFVPRTRAFKIEILPGQLALYDALAGAGRLRDPAHTGGAFPGGIEKAA